MADEALVINLETQLDEKSVRRDIKKLESAHNELHKKLITQQKEYNQGRKSSTTIGDITKTKTALAKNNVELMKYKNILTGINKMQSINTSKVMNETAALNTRWKVLDKTNGVINRQSVLLGKTNIATKILIQGEKRLSRDRQLGSSVYLSYLDKLNQKLREQATRLNRVGKEQTKVSKSRAKGTGTANGREGFTETMFGGAGTTFGHKVATTAHYAAAGAGIYALANAFRAGAEAVTEFDTATRTLSAVLNISHIDAKVLGQDLNDLGKAYGGTLKDIYGVTNALGRAGVATRDLVAGTEIVIKMAKLTGDTFDQATSALVSYSQVFGKDEQGDVIYTMEELGDKLANVANASRMSTQDIGTFSNYALAAAKSVGLSLDVVSGLAIAFSNAGVNASTAGTQVRRFTSLLLDDGKAATNMFDKLGIVQTNFVYDMKKSTESSNDAMESFVNKLKSLSDEEFLDIVQGMDLLATNSLNLIRNNSDAFVGAMKNSYSGVKGELQAVETIIGGVTSSWQRFKNTIADTTTDILNAGGFLDTITDLLVTYGEGVGVIFGSDVEKQIFRTTTSIRFLKRELRDDDLSPARKTEIEKELLRQGHRLDSMTKQKRLLEELYAEEKKIIETKRVTLNLNDAILNDDKELIAIYTKQYKLLKDIEKEEKKDKGPKAIIPPKVDTSIMLKSIQTLDAAGLDATTTFNNLKNSVEDFKKVTEGKIGALTEGLEKTGIVNKSLTGNAVESQTNLLNLLADGGKQLSKNNDERTHQIGIIKSLIRLYEGVITQENLVTQAVTTTSKSRAKLLRQTLKQEQASAKLNDSSQTTLTLYNEQIDLLDESLDKANKIKDAKVREEEVNRLTLEKTKLQSRYQKDISKSINDNASALNKYNQAFDPFYDYTESQAYLDLQKQIADLEEVGKDATGLKLELEMEIANKSKFLGVTADEFNDMASSSIMGGIQDGLNGEFDFTDLASGLAMSVGSQMTESIIQSVLAGKEFSDAMMATTVVGVGLMAISAYESKKARDRAKRAAERAKADARLTKALDELADINKKLYEQTVGKGTLLQDVFTTNTQKLLNTFTSTLEDYNKAINFRGSTGGPAGWALTTEQIEDIAAYEEAKIAIKEHASALITSIDSINEFSKNFGELSDSLSGTTFFADKDKERALDLTYDIFDITTEAELEVKLAELVGVTAFEDAEATKLGLASDINSKAFEDALDAISGLDDTVIDAIDNYEDIALAIEYLNELEEERLHLLENEATWLDFFKTEEELVVEQMEALSNSSVFLASNITELDELFELLRSDLDGLTDAELEFLEANRDLLDITGDLTDATDTVVDSLTGLVEGLEGLVVSAEAQILELLNIGATPTEDAFAATVQLQDLNTEFLSFFDDDGLLYPEAFDDMSSVFNELLNLTGEIVNMEGISPADQESMAILFAGQLEDAIDLFDASVDVLQVAIVSAGGLAEDATLVDMMTWLSNLFLENGLDVPAFANGGIVTGPTIGLIGEAGYNEAVIPLKNPDDPMGTQALLEELRSLKSEISDMKQLQIKQTANSDRQLNTTRALLDETIEQGA